MKIHAKNKAMKCWFDGSFFRSFTKKLKYVVPLSVCTLSNASYAISPNMVVTVGNFDNNVYSIDLTSGAVTNLTPGSSISGATLADVTLKDLNTAIVVGSVDNNLYSVDLGSGVVTKITSSSISDARLSGVALKDLNTAIVVGYLDSNLYSVDLGTGVVTKITPTAIPAMGPSDLALRDATTAITVGSGNYLFIVDLSTGAAASIKVSGASNLDSVVLKDRNTAIVSDAYLNNLWSVDLTTGAATKITPTPITPIITGSLSGVAMKDINTALSTDTVSNYLFSVDTRTGSFFQITPTSVSGALFTGLAAVPRISTGNLTGNNLRFANYLNQNAPFPTINFFFLQTNINAALKSAIPTRNAIGTFISQTTQLSIAQAVNNHLYQDRRIHHNTWKAANEVALSQKSDHLIAGCFNRKVMDLPPKKTVPCRDTTTYSPWFGVMGAFANEHAQQQTPPFGATSGGLIAACDYRGFSLPRLVGAGATYAHTYIHEKDGFGHAHVDQGSIAAYGTLTACRWYFDLALWGGYYHIFNLRKISLEGYYGRAKSKTHGWQTTPHFEVGYDVFEPQCCINSNWFGIEPFLMADWVSSWEHSLRERGTDGFLDFGQKKRWCSLLRSEAGVRFDETLSDDWGTITIREKASYAYQKAFRTGTLNAFLIGSPGFFQVTTLDGAQNLGVGALEFDFVPYCKKFPYGTISYQGQFGSRYQSHEGMITISMDY